MTSEQAEILPFVLAKQTAVTTFEREYLSRLMALTNGSIADAARIADLDRANLRKLLIRNRLRAPGRNTREFAKKKTEDIGEEPLDVKTSPSAVRAMDQFLLSLNRDGTPSSLTATAAAVKRHRRKRPRRKARKR